MAGERGGLAVKRLLFIAVLLLAAPAVASGTVSLDEIAEQTLDSASSPSLAETPERITIDPALRDALLAQTLDGGREQSLAIRFLRGRLTFDRATPGLRYQTGDICQTCNYPQPIRGHTHPYENPFSVVDLKLAAASGSPNLVVTRGGQIYLALPTSGSRALVEERNQRILRYGLFANRLQCPARAPADGWAASTPMGRNVEIVMRGAAHDLGVAIYVLEGSTFRRLANVDHDERVLRVDEPVTTDQLNAYELSLLRVLHQVRLNGDVDPSGADRRFEAMLSGGEKTEKNPSPEAKTDAIELAQDWALGARDVWLAALPTTAYRRNFADPTVSVLPFASVQWSGDCRNLLVLEGEQTFAPNGVRYSRGWRRPATATGAWNEGWTPMDPDALPTGQVVPW